MGPSAIHESGHFYFAQTGHSHFAATAALTLLARKDFHAKFRVKMSVLVCKSSNLARMVPPVAQQSL